MIHRPLICAFVALLALTYQVAHADPPTSEQPRHVPTIYVLKPGLEFPPNPFQPRMHFGLFTGSGFTPRGSSIDEQCTLKNGFGHLRRFTWRTGGPALKSGLVLPLFGVVGRLHNEGLDLTFRTIAEADLPPGVKHVGTDFPMYLGGRHEHLKLTSIGTDEAGRPFAEAVQLRTAQPDLPFPRLFVDSIWTIESEDTITRLRVEQIVPPDERRQIVGWVTLRPEGTGVEPRREGPVKFKIPDTITITNRDIEKLLESRESTPAVEFVATQVPTETDGQRTLSIIAASFRHGAISRAEQCTTTYPKCQVGMVLPLCGGVGRVESIDTNGVRFKMLTGTDSRAGVTGAANDFPLILGTPTNDLSVERIGIDADGVLSVDLVHKQPNLAREQFTRLKLDSSFSLRDADTVTEYRITELVPPDADQHIVGWIKLRPIGGGIRERAAGE